MWYFIKAIMKIISLLFTLAVSFPIKQVDPIEAEFDEYMARLDKLPTDEYTQVIDRLSGQFKTETGKSFDDLQQMSADEFDNFIINLNPKK